MKRPAIALAISAGAILIGSSVCFPGICGCASWLPLSNPDKFGLPFALLTFAGEMGVLVSLGWLVVSAIRTAFFRTH